MAIDSVLMDANAATAVRPAGLRNGVSHLDANRITGGAFAAVVGDIKLLYGALQTATLGNVRDPVWLMSPALALALTLTVAPNGTFAFPTVTLDGGTLAGIPDHRVAQRHRRHAVSDRRGGLRHVRAAGCAWILSDSATLHMEDTAPDCDRHHRHAERRGRSGAFAVADGHARHPNDHAAQLGFAAHRSWSLTSPA